MDVLLLMNEQATGLQVARDVAVALLHEPARYEREFISERPIGSDTVDQRRPLPLDKTSLLGDQHRVVNLSKRRRDVHDTRPGVSGHEIGGHHAPRNRC